MGGNVSAATHNSIGYQRGQISVDGDAQTNETVLYNTINQGASSDIFTDGSSTHIIVPSNAAIGFEIHLVALQTAGSGDASFRRYEGLIKNIGATVIVGAVTEFIVAQDSELITVSVTGGSGFIRVNVTELLGVSPIKVSAFVRFTQTLF
jgi:hypothetical protein